MRRLALVGVGLMGGSLGLALRAKGWRVAGLGRRAKSLAQARRRGAIHEAYLDPRAALAGADAVVFCVPVDRIVPLARRYWSHIPAGALVMDVGGVKGPVVRALERLPGAAFVGAHPMAGSEKAGVGHARADLYRGSTCALTPTPRTPRRALAAAETFWAGVGARTLRLSPQAHDRAVGLVSHLPHLIADALVLSAEKSKTRAAALRLAAGSFRDATRVAQADPDLWRAIFEMNAPALREALGIFLGTLRGLVRARWPLAALKEARHARAQLRG